MSSERRRISRPDLECAYPLLPMQKGMLFHDLAEPDAQPYFRQASFRIEGLCEAALCERVWNELMARHETLRSSFEYENTAEPLQLVWKRRSAEFTTADLSTLDEAAQTAAIEAYRERDRARGFDLRRDPLVRVHFARLGERRFEMIWSHPHIILDGWSGAVLIEEFARLYSDFAKGRLASLPPAPSYSAYLEWFASRDMEASRRYWADLLSGYETPAGLPRRRTKVYDPRERSFAFGREETSALRALAARNSVTLSAAVESLWSVVLARYNDAEDVVFGKVVSGRPAEVPGVERMAGLFINTIPVRVRLGEARTFASLLRNVQRASLDAMAHDHVPLAEIQAQSALKQSLLDHILVFENYPENDSAGMEFQVTSTAVSERANYDFGVLILPGEALSVSFHYNGAAHSEEQMARLERYVRNALARVLHDENTPIDEFAILDSSDVIEARGPAVPWPREETLASLFEAQAARTPDNPAVAFDGAEWSYRELNERANRIAHALQARLAPEDRIGALMERGPWRIAALLGVLKAGGAYCPISAACPEERLRFLLEDSGCRTVLTDAPNKRRMEAVRLGLAIDIADLAAGPAGDPPPRATPRSLAYVIYTSGSTGRPKGVLIEHGGFVNMILDQIRGFGVAASDRMLQFASSSFDASLSEIFMALLSGACLSLIREETIRDGARFQEFMREERISVVTLPPSYLRALGRPEFPALRVLITAGEPPDLEDVRHYARRLRYFNAYGPTEVSVCATFGQIRPGDPLVDGAPIGRPVANCRIRLLDRRGRPVPVSAPGELWIAGPGLARGYLNAPELTADKFIIDCGERWYHTGDLARWSDGGEILYLGRADAQVKFRGYRIEPGEIESVLREHPGVAQAAAAVRDGQLAAWFVSETAPDLEALRERLARRLPAHMVPSRLTRVDALPRTLAGKIDRAALPAPANAAPPDAAEPRTEAERAVAAVWREVLGRDRLGIHDSFFALGGDSLKAIQAIGRLNRRGWKMDLRDLVERQTIAALSGAVKPWQPASAPVSGTAPLTPIERWFFDEHAPANWPRLSHALLLRAPGDLDEAPFHAAVAALWRRHDALRSRFPRENGTIVHEIDPAGAPPRCGQLDLRAEPNPWRRIESYVDALHNEFALETGPLFKAVHCRLPEADYALLLAHHLTVDAVSWRFLLEDFATAYEQARAGEAVHLPPKTSSYLDWSRALAAYSQSAALAAQKPYWSAVESAAVKPIPTDFPAASHHYGETSAVNLDLPFEAPDNGVHAALLAALARTLRRWTGAMAFRVQLTWHGRTPIDRETDVSRTVGWFSANFPFLLQDRGGDEGALARLHQELAAVPDGGVGYGVLRHLAGAPCADPPEISLNYLGRLDSQPAGAFTLCDRLPSSSTGRLERTQKLEFEAALTGSRLALSIRYSPKLHRPETAARLGRWFGEELHALTDAGTPAALTIGA